jgi:hypothetical protein
LSVTCSGARVAQWVRELDYLTTHTSLSPLRHGFTPGFVNYKKSCTWLAAVCDKVYQLLTHGRWFSPGTLASSTTKTARHNIAEILLKVVLNTKNQTKSSVTCNRSVVFSRVLWFTPPIKLTTTIYLKYCWKSR